MPIGSTPCTAQTIDDAPAGSSAIPSIRLEPVVGGHVFNEPIQVVGWPGDPDAIAVVERSGKMIKASVSKDETSQVLDLRKIVNDRNSEEGLLSAAFHPDFPTTPEVYVWYTVRKPRQTVLARFKLGEDGTAAADAGETILAIDQPYWNHNGGTVLFGPDGMLYLSVGDGGSANDPKGHGQNLNTLLGTVLRIDVSKPDGNQLYTVPADNPFVGVDGVRPEIWAWGLRNVWRMAFDSQTGELWAGDVGQNAWEEVDIITKGGNYGWNAREGKHAFRRGKAAEGASFIEPVAEYGREDGGSITGGEVIRQAGSHDGVYVFSDYMSGKMWGLRRNADGTVQMNEILRGGRPRPVSSFGRGVDGRVYAAAFDAPYTSRGRIYQLVP